MNILILSRGTHIYSTRRLVEAVRERGHEALVLDPTRCYVVTEKNAHALFFGETLVEDVQAVIPRIGASITSYGAVIVRQLEMMGVYTSLRSLALRRVRDKLRTLQILARKGIAIPKTAFAMRPRDIDRLIAEVGGAPLVIKLIEGTQGSGVVLADTEVAARSTIEAFYRMQAQILVQRFIAEAKGADIRVIVVNGKVIASMKRQSKDGDFRSNLHQGGKSSTVKLTRAERAIAKRATKALGLTVAGVDLLRSKDGPLVLEVNASPGLEGIEKTTGVNVAGAIVDYVVEAALAPPRRDTVGS